MAKPSLKPLFTWRSAISSKESGLTPTQRHVALALSLHMNEKGGSCFPSVRTLCDETGLSNRAVIDALRALEGGDWLEVYRRKKGKGGRGWANGYRATVPLSVNLAHSLGSTKCEPPSIENPETVNLLPIKCEPGSPEDVLRTLKNEDVGKPSQSATPKPNPEGAARARQIRETLRTQQTG